MDDMQRFKETYITECYELLQDMEERLFALNENNPDIEDINAIFRCAHSIKGGSGAFGFDKIKNFTHILEGLLDGMRESSITITREAIDALLASVDIVKQMVEAVQLGTDVAENFGAHVVLMLENIANKGSAAQTIANHTSISQNTQENEVGIYEIYFKPHPAMLLTGNEPLLIIKELKSLGEATVIPEYSSVPSLELIDPESCYICWNITLETNKSIYDLNEIFAFVEGNCDLTINQIAGFNPRNPQLNKTAPAAKSSPEDAPKDEGGKVSPAVTSIRVDVNKVDRLVNMVGEIVITQAMIAAQVNKLRAEDHPELIKGLETLSQHTIELQEAVMSVRMQPLKSVFSRMPRIVRDLSNQLEKDIRLETFGENTEIDKTVIEQLSDPLMHIIRNSADHGIEDPESRISAGKPKQGVITLSAEHTGGKIIIKISDDGHGINREKVMRKAIEKGLVAPDATLTNPEIDHLIFTAGFSTADVISDISGRGVGMDVVKRNIEALGGNVHVFNRPMEGATFVITLPLTLAILDGMIVKVGEEKYILPIGSIIESLRPQEQQIRQIIGANDLINVRGEFIPLVYLYKIFNIAMTYENPCNSLVVLVEDGAEKFGLVVDELIGQQQVVIKSLEENSQAVPGISAATILGDGKVSLILDIAQLQSMAIAAEKVKNLANVYI
jgi:two-component system chemotaxis sensor kinase CheA